MKILNICLDTCNKCNIYFMRKYYYNVEKNTEFYNILLCPTCLKSAMGLDS